MKKAPISTVLEIELDCLYYIHVFLLKIKNNISIIELIELTELIWSRRLIWENVYGKIKLPKKVPKNTEGGKRKKP